MAVWLVRAGSNGEDEASCLDSGMSIIGFREIGDLSGAATKEDFRAAVAAALPSDPKGRVVNFAAQLYGFVRLMEKGDIVALPRKRTGKIALGRVVGSYEYREVDGAPRHTRKVDWLLPEVSRSVFGQDLLYSLGAFLTACRIKRNDAEGRIEKILAGEPDPGLAAATDLDMDQAEATEAIEEQVNLESEASDRIREFIEANFKGHELTRLIDEILRAEGYFTYMSPPGPDGGVDIMGRKGALGFEGQKLCVQVKSSTSPCDVTVFRGLQGTMQTFQADRGLLVSWGGFNKVVRVEARAHFYTIRLWDSQDVMEALYQNYDQLSDGLRAELPLKRIWTMVLDG